MARGRKPIPTQLKILNGNPGHRPLNENEPTPREGLPTCPKHLDGEARKEWNRLTKELDECGVLTKLDRGALAAYCAAYSRWIRAEKALAEDGSEVLQGTEGGKYQNPYLAIVNKALENMLRYGSLLGLDPSSRTKIKVQKKDTVNSVGNFARKRDRQVS